MYIDLSTLKTNHTQWVKMFKFFSIVSQFFYTKVYNISLLFQFFFLLGYNKKEAIHIHL